MVAGKRVFLSPPDCGPDEAKAVEQALASGWIAPLGPDVDAFEADIGVFCGVGHAVALSSGTAGLHLALKALGVAPGSEVVVPTLTFGATAFAVTYTGASPVFIDVEGESWNLDPALLESLLTERARSNRLPSAVITVDVFGRPCDYENIEAICGAYDVPILEDAAEALGARHGAQAAGQFGRAAVFSFNGNKIMTTSGGGMVVTNDESLADKVRFWSTQSREPYPWYEHQEIGYNHRLSNILAAMGRAQLKRLPAMIDRRRAIRDRYAGQLDGCEGVIVTGDPAWGRGNGWLTTVLFDGERHPQAPTRVREALESANIESRHVWKPMHQQPVFVGAECALTGEADRLFMTGLCLPTGSTLADHDVDRVAELVRLTLGV